MKKFLQRYKVLLIVVFSFCFLPSFVYALEVCCVYTIKDSFLTVDLQNNANDPIRWFKMLYCKPDSKDIFKCAEDENKLKNDRTGRLKNEFLKYAIKDPEISDVNNFIGNFYWGNIDGKKIIDLGELGICPNLQDKVVSYSTSRYFVSGSHAKMLCDILENFNNNINQKDEFDRAWEAVKPIIEGKTKPPPAEKKVDKLEVPSTLGDLNKMGNVDIPVLIGKGIKLLMQVIGTIALLMFVYGGLLWMVSAGNTEKTKKAMDIMLWAGLGVIVILSSYAIVNFVFDLVK